MLYQIVNGTVSVGGQTILSHINFFIKGTEKVAIVGENGAGKTTLLRLLSGELGLDRDDKRQSPGIQKSRDLVIRMLHQTGEADPEKTVEELWIKDCPCEDRFSKEGFSREMEYDRMFTELGFSKEQKKQKIASFSGGEQTKIKLIHLLLQKPDLLLLDEPTNHLDVETVEWLEEYLKEYDRAVVIVSHDRFFLDQVVDVVYDLAEGSLKRYVGNYTRFCQLKEQEWQKQQKAYERQQEEIARMQALVEKFKHKPKKAAFARSRKTMLNRMEKIKKPRENPVHHFAEPLEPNVIGSKWVYEAEDLKIGYDKLLATLSLRIRRGHKIGIVGANGCGKSTFLKTVVGMLEPLAGKSELGNQIQIGFFDQQTAALDSPKSIWEHFGELFPGMPEKERRSLLGRYLFSGESVGKKVGKLSGGEKSRLVLAEILTSRPNFLVLDEPTNHMDIPAKETLESAFLAYRGTILFVSHDRYFLKRVADSILVFEEGKVFYYPFGYEHYLSKKRRAAGENPEAMLKAEEAAMLEEFHALPKAQRYRMREIDEERAYVDWKLRLVQEAMEEVKPRVERLYQLLAENEERILADEEACLERKKTLLAEMEKEENTWTDLCLTWYRIWEEGYGDWDGNKTFPPA